MKTFTNENQKRLVTFLFILRDKKEPGQRLDPAALDRTLRYDYRKNKK